MKLIETDEDVKCFHCGDQCHLNYVQFDKKHFCCLGCQSVYQILLGSDLVDYYSLESTPGLPQSSDKLKFNYLENPEISSQVLDFASESLEKVRFFIPSIHCSSCIWLLENLHRINQGVLLSRANIGEKVVAVDYDPRILTLSDLVQLLVSIGYEPVISLDQQEAKTDHAADRALILKIAVAGFCFGNIMLLSFPDYLGLDLRIDGQLASWFKWITVALSIPVLAYCSSDYFKSAVNGLRQRYLNIDVPIALGILALAGRSYYEIVFDIGTGYLDSLAGLLFLLLIGRWFQHRTYNRLSFSRDFKSYFPLAVSKLDEGREQSVLVGQLQAGDVIMIRNSELIPADCVLLDEIAGVDYSFVNGESREIARRRGSIVFAGGRHIGLSARYQVQKPVSQSYLTQLWNHHSFREQKHDPRELMINSISKYFTVVVLLLAFSAAFYWLFIDPSRSVFVFTSVLIVACPCALAMTTPFTLGTMVNVFGRNKLYLKNAQVIDKMANISTLVFDKTGTLTELKGKMVLSGSLTADMANMLAALAVHSNHPVSRNVLLLLKDQFNLDPYTCVVSDFKEIPGMGISGKVNGSIIKLGNATFVGTNGSDDAGTLLSVDGKINGNFKYSMDFREGLGALFRNLTKGFRLALLSGDSDYQRTELENKFPLLEQLSFRQSPFDKLEFVSNLQKQGEKVMMLGDGLNDAGALQQSDVGIAVTDQTQHFTPASDGILHASVLGQLPAFMKLARCSRVIIVSGFVCSFLYNLVGLAFAVSGNLSPLIAAVLMPTSSISIVIFTTMAVKLAAVNLKLN
ncbi:MAG: ATPase [Cyclobacteriaceae bacterium]|nr:MAG: ATPase [Cyclobacteriaceae bacterium]